MTSEPVPPPRSPARDAAATFACLAALAGAFWFALTQLAGGADHDFAGLYDALLLGRDRAVGAGLSWAFETTRGEMRRPLFWLAIAAENALGGRPAAAIHVASAALHVAASVSIVALALRMFRPARDGLTGLLVVLVTSVWLFHPLRVEPVACASQQGTVLGGALLAAAAVSWCRSLAGATTRRGASAALAVGLLVAALLADPTLCFAPAALLALALWLRRDEAGLPAETGRALTIAWIAATLGLVATFAVREPGGDAAFLPAALATASAIVRPLRATVWPVHLHPGYDAPPGFPGEIAPSLWIDAVTLTALVVFCVRGVRRRDGLGLALFAYLALAAGPALLRRDGFGADGDAYVATIPLFLAVAGGLAVAARQAGRRRWLVAGVAGLVVFSVTSPRGHGGGAAWTDEATLAKSVVDDDPANERALVAMGDSARRSGTPAGDLVRWYGSILEHGDRRPLAHARLGAALLETGDAAGARRHLERAVAIAPWLAAARFDLGALELREGGLDAARAELEAAARLDADSAETWRLLARARDAAGDRSSAADAIRRGAALAPLDPAIAEELRRLAPPR